MCTPSFCVHPPFQVDVVAEDEPGAEGGLEEDDDAHAHHPGDHQGPPHTPHQNHSSPEWGYR